MPASGPFRRRQCIPVIYTKGTHYDVGFDVGRTFATIIHSFVDTSKELKNKLLPAYQSSEGRKAYDETLDNVKRNFPQYVRELEGTADGANISFHILFLFHMDRIITTAANIPSKSYAIGCSSICLNQPNQEILGHTEDALNVTLNHFYFVSAHIISETPHGVIEEKFTSLCYAGHLPGYTMSYNHHGLIFSINTLTASEVYPGKTPRYFITRALLAAENFTQVQETLQDPRYACGDGCSINMTFLQQEGERLFFSVEMAPSSEKNRSQLDILMIRPGENYMHFNSYLRLSVKEFQDETLASSFARLETLKKYPVPRTKKDVIEMLGDHSGIEYQVFQDYGPDDATTIAAGVFDCNDKTWSIYSDNPRYTDPIVVFPILLKK